MAICLKRTEHVIGDIIIIEMHEEDLSCEVGMFRKKTFGAEV